PPSVEHSSRGPLLMVVGLVLFLVAGGVVFFTQTQLGGAKDVTSVANSQNEAPKEEPKPAKAAPEKREEGAKNAPDESATPPPEANAGAKTHGNSAATNEVKPPPPPKSEAEVANAGEAGKSKSGDSLRAELEAREKKKRASGRGPKALDDK